MVSCTVQCMDNIVHVLIIHDVTIYIYIYTARKDQSWPFCVHFLNFFIIFQQSYKCASLVYTTILYIGNEATLLLL